MTLFFFKSLTKLPRYKQWLERSKAGSSAEPAGSDGESDHSDTGTEKMNRHKHKQQQQQGKPGRMQILGAPKHFRGTGVIHSLKGYCLNHQVMTFHHNVPDLAAWNLIVKQLLFRRLITRVTIKNDHNRHVIDIF